MTQMYKVFYNNRIVFFTEKVKNLLTNDKILIHYYKSKAELADVLAIFKNDVSKESLYVVCNDVEAAFREYCSLYKIIEAAGGLVRSKDNRFLFIFRRGKWDLPKGKVEKYEKYEKAALREVEEECGITHLKLLKPITITYHTYVLHHKDILKPTYWYEMSYHGKEKPTPQTEEDITKAKWLKESQFDMVKENTFLSILEVLEKGIKRE